MLKATFFVIIGGKKDESYCMTAVPGKICHPDVVAAIKKLPTTAGVYLFKNDAGCVIYVGKAKNLKSRVATYVATVGHELKSQLILEDSVALDYLETANELEALVVEAKLIQSHQPRYNILLKTGQPFLYLTITSGEEPVLKIVRTRRIRGSYFGPFVEKTAARRVYNFLMRTFKLFLCGKKIAGGCLNYHLGICAGSCRADFDKAAYVQRIELARQVLEKGHSKFLKDLREQITLNNMQLNFEKSRELHGYYASVEKIFKALGAEPTVRRDIERKDFWLRSVDERELFVYQERGGVFKKRHSFILRVADEEINTDELIKECFLGFYRSYTPAVVIITNYDFGADALLYAEFLTKQHSMPLPVTIQYPHEGHYAALLRMGLINLEQERAHRKALSEQLKKLFETERLIERIDCFDISHKQGTFMVGACVRFVQGQPDPSNFRRFTIKTVEGQDDYASLREVVSRRYRDAGDLPDLVLIDGGKGQLSAVAGLGLGGELASLAKREETIYSPRFPEGKVLDQALYVSKVLIALRDYTHHFAITFHRLSVHNAVVKNN